MQGLRTDNIKTLEIFVLVADDEPFNVEIVSEYLEDADYTVDTAYNGKQAIKLLDANPNKYHVVLLDKMMPDMGGLEVLKYMQSNPELQFIPVVLQTAKATKQDIRAGLDAGVLYYLTKPFDSKSLLAIIDTAVSGYINHKTLRAVVSKRNHASVQTREYSFRTLDEARDIATMLAAQCPEPGRVVVGLCELFINAVEHGNLNIGYAKKTQLHKEGRWEEEVARRLELAENVDKKVTVGVDNATSEIRFQVRDEGMGFDSEQYLNINPERSINTHGRGIAIAKMMSFDQLQYIGCGNELLAVVKTGTNG